MAQQSAVPPTPQVTEPTPAPSDSKEKQDSYFAPITSSLTKRRTESSKFDDERARARSRSPKSI
ncbi:MAG: hypothetical protein Q9212_007538, partial [Teloschistes hypoglaucus]